jgi:hypothetical protein
LHGETGDIHEFRVVFVLEEVHKPEFLLLNPVNNKFEGMWKEL